MHSLSVSVPNESFSTSDGWSTVNHRIPDRMLRDGGDANGYTVTRQKGYLIKKAQHCNMIKKRKMIIFGIAT